MKNIQKLLSLSLIILSISIPISASAEWKQNNIGWWYTDGTSWATGWRYINDNWYYFNTNGYMETGWKEIDNSYYYFYKDGSMARNAKIDGLLLDSNGRWISKKENDRNISITEQNAIDKILGTIEIENENIIHNYYEVDLNGLY